MLLSAIIIKVVVCDKTNITVYLQLTNVNCDFNKNIVKLMVERNIWG